MRRSNHVANVLALTPLALAVSMAYANPQGAAVVRGSVSMSTQGSTLTITNSPGSIINWQSFSINANEVTRFIQQSASSQVLNRVVGVDPSVILGALQSNGRVFLINPNGIVFGQGSQVNVAGLVASTLNITNENFLAGQLKLEAGAVAGRIRNEGAITAARGGQIILVAPQVENSGIIRAPDGDILLAAGRSANLVDLKNPEISVEITAPADKVLNVGQLIAKNVSVYGAIVENRGAITATSAVVGEGGRVSLRAKRDVVTAPASEIRAEGSAPGAVTIRAETGAASIAGTISVDSTAGTGGSVEIAAPQVKVAEAARVSASGELGGGSISLDARRMNASASSPAPAADAGLQLKASVEIARTARMSANAKSSGSGGTVEIRSEDDARVSGVVEVRSDHSGTPLGEAAKPFLLVRRPDSASDNAGGTVRMQSDAGLLVVDGTIDVSSLAGIGGTVQLNADVLMQLGMVQAVGADGGLVAMQARNVLSAAPVVASGLTGRGGEIDVQASAALVQTSAAQFSVDGAEGGHLRVQAGHRLFSSATLSAVGSTLKGGTIEVLANDIVLRGAALDASGALGGGTLLVGGDFQGKNAAIPNAATAHVNFSTTLTADARTNGDGGKVIVWSDDATKFYGRISARGGARSGDGGFIEVSGKQTLTFGGLADAGAPNGKAGTLLLDPKNIIIDAAAGGPSATDLVDPNIGAGDQFGANAVVLTNGNIVAPDPGDDLAASNAGAVYLFNGSTGALVSTLTGSVANDAVSSGGVTALSNGNFVVRSINWNNGAATQAGAVTWGSGTSGLSGVVSAANSLVGSTTLDQVGLGGVTALTNGNYVVSSYNWRNGAATQAGAATWGSGTTGVAGVVSAANSLVGTTSGDRVSMTGVTALTDGNYVVISSGWNDGPAPQAGAVTWGSGTTGVVGAVSATNSLIGSNAGDNVGSGGVTVLTNGNYVVRSPFWDNGVQTNAGAVTWGSGTTGVSGAVSAANSLIGSSSFDAIGSGGITALTNGNYVVISPDWDDNVFLVTDVGAVTWGNGSSGIVGAVSAANSLVGSIGPSGLVPADQVGSGGVVALTNGNYIVISPNWHNGFANFAAGAVTWGSGTSGVTGAVSAANSLVGSAANDQVGSGRVFALTNGNYVVHSPLWTNGAAAQAGAVTWGNGSVGVTGAVGPANSLVGSAGADQIGSGGIITLATGNYVVSSPSWNNGAIADAGAVTWGSGSSATVGALSAANSLVGSTANDQVGFELTALTNGNYVVRSPVWDRGAIPDAGAVTWASGTSGVSGVITTANSLVGTVAFDSIGSGGVIALTNGNYVVRSVGWDNGAIANAGAVTWGSGTVGVAGTVSAANSLVGSTLNDNVGGGTGGGIFALPSGNYMVTSATWDNGAATDAGAVTFGNGTSGVVGTISTANSLLGVTSGDRASSVFAELSANRVLVASPQYDNGAANTGRLQIFSASGGGGAFANPLTFGDDAGGTSTLTPSQITAITNTGTAVVLQANNDITLMPSSAITTSAGGAGGAITMQAGRSIAINSNITTDNGALTLVANETAANGVVTAERDAGVATLATAAGTTINAGSGNVTLRMRDGGAAGNMTLDGAITTTGTLTATSASTATTMTVGNTLQARTMDVNLAGGLTIFGGTDNLVPADLRATHGQTITARSILLDNALATARITNQGGNQIITVNNASSGSGLEVAGAAGIARIEHDPINAAGTQTIIVNDGDYLRVAGTGANAEIRSTAAQTILVQGSRENAIQVGTTGSTLRSSIIGLSQSITAGTGAETGSILVRGGAGPDPSGTNAARISSTGAQTIATTGLLWVEGGSATLRSASVTAGGIQSLTADAIRVTGGGGANVSNASASIVGTSQALTVGGGGLTLTGGSGSGSADANQASIFQSGTAAGESQTITVNDGGAISLQAGSSAGTVFGSPARVTSAGLSQTVQFTSGGNLFLGGGTVGANNHAMFANTNNAGLQTISGATSILLQGGASGGREGPTSNDSMGNAATLRGNGSQEITVGSGGISAFGGTGNGADNFAQVRQGPVTGSPLPGSHQTITLTNGGSITLQGGSTAAIATANGNGSYGRIRGEGDTQTINFTAGGSISISGGSGGSSNFAEIRSDVAAQTITGSPTVTLVGGSGAAGALSGDGNFARIRSDVSQTLTLGSVESSGGNGTETFSSIHSPTQNITVNGNLVLTGATGGSSTSNGARIGGPGDGPTNVSLTVHGNITLNGGPVADAGSAIGSSPNSATPQVANVTIAADGNVTLNGGTAGGTRIGQPSGLVGGGDISVTAGGNITLNNGSGTTAGSIRTTGNVTLHADAAGMSITQASNSVILANTLTATADSGITLAGTGNQVTNLAAANASANGVTYNQAPGTNVTIAGTGLSGGGAITVAADAIVVGAPVRNSGSGISLTARQNSGITIATGGTLDPGGGTIAFTTPTTPLLSGGTIANTTLTTPVSVSTANGGTFDNVALDVDLAVTDAILNVRNGLTLSNRTITVAAPIGNTSGLWFAGPSQTLGGTGEIVLGGNNSSGMRVGVDLDGGLTIASGITLWTSAGASAAIGLVRPLTNLGTIAADGAGSRIDFVDNFAGANATFTNSGTLRASNGSTIASNTTGTVTTNAAPGIIRAAGASTISIANFEANAGTIEVLDGSTFTTSNASLINNGTVGGSGTINVGANNTLTNSGRLRAGTSPGTLNITGNLELSPTSIIDVELQAPGTTAGTDYDVINVSGRVRGATGALTNWGTLNVLHLGGFAPGAGSSFTIMNYDPSSSGDFTTKNFPGGFAYTATPGAQSYVLALGAGTANTWIATTGLWEIASNWSLGHAPTASEDAVIPDVGTIGVADHTITVSAAAQARGVTSSENLTVSSGALTLGTGSSATNAGLTISGGTLTANGPLAATSLTQTGGTLSGTGTVTVSGATSLANAIMTGSGSLITQGPLTITGPVNLDGERVLDVRGGATWSDGDINLNSGVLAGSATLFNRAGSTFSSSADGRFIWAQDQGPGDNGTSALFTNEGTFVKSAGNGVVTLSRLANSGTIQVQSGTVRFDTTSTHSGTLASAAGAIFEFSSGTHSLNSVSAAGGTLWLSGGTLDVAGATSVGEYEQFGGTLTGPGTVTVSGETTLANAAMTGPGSLITQGPLTITGPVNLDGGRVLDVRGGATWSDGDINLNSGVLAGSASLFNRAGSTFNSSADGRFIWAQDQGPGDNGTSALFTNEGTFVKTSGPGPVWLSRLANSGTINVQSGIVRFDATSAHTGTLASAAGATLDFSAGTHTLTNVTATGALGTLSVSGGEVTTSGILNNAGTLDISIGTLTAGAAINTASYTQSGGTLAGSGTVTVSGATTLANAAMTGPGSLITQGPLTITGPVNLDGGRVLDVRGGATWSEGDINLNSGVLAGSATLFNRAGSIFNSSADGRFIWAQDQGPGDDGTSALFTNEGTFVKSAGSGTITISAPLVNAGTLQVQSGTLQASAFPTNSGTVTVASGAVLSTNGNSLTSSGTIQGSGTIDVGGGFLTNSGTLRAGTSPGTLTIAGDLALTGTSIVEVEIQAPGATAGTDYDLINVTRSASLNGTLNVTHTGGFSPAPGSTFGILNYASVAGDFATKNFPVGFGYSTNPAAPTYTLTLASLSSTNTWIGTTGLWEIAANWSLGHVPTAGEDAVIPDVGTPGAGDTITVSAAAQTARTVTAAENLTISAGALGLGAGASATNAALTISGGTLSVGGTLSARTLSLAGGSLSGSGSVTIPSGGTATLDNGDLRVGTFNVAAGATANFSNTSLGAPFFQPATFNNSGIVNWAAASAGLRTASGTTTFNNQSGAQFNILGASTWDVCCSGGSVAFNNQSGATLTKAGAGTTTFASGVGLTNAGTININAGVLQVADFPANAGTINVGAGTSLTTGANLSNTGTIAGNGTIDVGAATLTNGGTLQPMGILTIAGNATLAPSSNVDIALRGAGGTAGVDYDALNVTGNAALGGALRVTHAGGFSPAPGAGFNVVSYGSRAGDFAARSAPAGFGYVATLDPFDYRLTLLGVTNTWTGVSGLWESAANWSLGHAPTALEDVAIPDVGVPGVSDTVAVSAAGQAARSVTAFENLTVSGGALTLGTGASTTNGMLTLQSGALTVNGTLAARDVRIGNTATATMNGAFTVAGSAELTGGTLAGAGSFTLDSGAFAALMGTSIQIDTMTISSGGSMSVTPANPPFGANVVLDNRGLINLGTGTLALSQFTNPGILDLGTGGTLAMGPSSFTNTGTIRGTGTIQSAGMTNAGTLAPGASPGALHVIGDLTLAPTSTVLMELGGTAAGAFDVIEVSGTLTMDGALSAQLINGFTPGASSNFSFLSYGAGVGGFSSLSLPAGFNVAFGPNGVDALFAPPVVVPPVAVTLESPILTDIRSDVTRTTTTNELPSALDTTTAVVTALQLIRTEQPIVFESSAQQPRASSAPARTVCR